MKTCSPKELITVGGGDDGCFGYAMTGRIIPTDVGTDVPITIIPVCWPPSPFPFGQRPRLNVG